jgi:hypothetical protein
MESQRLRRKETQSKQLLEYVPASMVTPANFSSEPLIAARVIFDLVAFYQRLLFDLKFTPGKGHYRYQDESTIDCGETLAVDLPRRFKYISASISTNKDRHCPIIVTILDPAETDATKQEKGKTSVTPGNSGSVTGEDAKRVTFKCDGKKRDGTCHLAFDIIAY